MLIFLFGIGSWNHLSRRKTETGELSSNVILTMTSINLNTQFNSKRGNQLLPISFLYRIESNIDLKYTMVMENLSLLLLLVVWCLKNSLFGVFCSYLIPPTTTTPTKTPSTIPMRFAVRHAPQASPYILTYIHIPFLVGKVIPCWIDNNVVRFLDERQVSISLYLSRNSLLPLVYPAYAPSHAAS